VTAHARIVPAGGSVLMIEFVVCSRGDALKALIRQERALMAVEA
jgi:hypothetical protein